MGTFICQLACLFATILRTDSLEIATAEVTPQTLCVFDVDLVLIQPANPAFQIPNIKRFNGKRFLEGLTQEEQYELINIISVNEQSTLVEADAPCLVRRLNDQKKSMVCLTNTAARSPYVEDKLERLRKLGFRFAPLCKKPFVFKNLPEIGGAHPLYYGGVIFCNDVPKGRVLVDFLKRTCLNVNRVVFIDDLKYNLEDVERALRKYNRAIEFQGYLYTAAYSYPSEEISQTEFDEQWEQALKQMHRKLEQRDQ